MRAFINSLCVAALGSVACQSELPSAPAVPASTAPPTRVAPTMAMATPRATAAAPPAAASPPSASTAAAGARANMPPAMARVPNGAPVTGVPMTPGGAAMAAGAGAVTQPPPPMLSADCNPSDKKPDPTRVPITQLQGYQRLAKAPTTGPSNPIIETDPGLPEWTIYRPEVFAEGAHPVLAWAQGGCLKNGTLYGQWLLELASWGYIMAIARAHAAF